MNQPVLVGPYRLGNSLGKGAFGTVYRALDTINGDIVAIKQLNASAFQEDKISTFMKEVDILKSLNHPNIVQFYDCIRTEDHLNIVLEFVESGSLSTSLQQFGNFPERLVSIYTRQILKGLEYLHSRDVVHCDIKAGNLLTTKNGDVKLTDFGVSSSLTDVNKNETVGSTYWMAPEIINLEGACKESDIWSLGCTVIELISGSPPYFDLDQMSALYKIVNEEPPECPCPISPELDNFLRNCLVKQPYGRSSATDLLNHTFIKTYEPLNEQELQDASSTENNRRTLIKDKATEEETNEVRPPPKEYFGFDLISADSQIRNTVAENFEKIKDDDGLISIQKFKVLVRSSGRLLIPEQAFSHLDGRLSLESCLKALSELTIFSNKQLEASLKKLEGRNITDLIKSMGDMIEEENIQKLEAKSPNWVTLLKA